MKNSVVSLSLLLILAFQVFGCSTRSPVQEKSIAFKVFGRHGKPVFNTEEPYRPGDTVLSFTQRVLEKHKIISPSQEICGEQGIVELFGVRSFEQVKDKKNRKSYGWCYYIDNALIEVVPSKSMLTPSMKEVTWHFAYSEQKDGNWISQCVKEE